MNKLKDTEIFDSWDFFRDFPDGWICNFARSIENKVIEKLQPVGITSSNVEHWTKGYKSRNSCILYFAVESWKSQVATRPISNLHRRTLDDVWRQVIRECGGDDRKLLGPTHDELLAEGYDSL